MDKLRCSKGLICPLRSGSENLKTIRGGFIYLYGANKLAVRLTGNRIKSRIRTEYKDFLSLYIETEVESIFLFSPDNFEFVAKLIKDKRKR